MCQEMKCTQLNDSTILGNSMRLAKKCITLATVQCLVAQSGKHTQDLHLKDEVESASLGA